MSELTEMIDLRTTQQNSPAVREAARIAMAKLEAMSFDELVALSDEQCNRKLDSRIRRDMPSFLSEDILGRARADGDVEMLELTSHLP